MESEANSCETDLILPGKKRLVKRIAGHLAYWKLFLGVQIARSETKTSAQVYNLKSEESNKAAEMVVEFIVLDGLFGDFVCTKEWM